MRKNWIKLKEENFIDVKTEFIKRRFFFFSFSLFYIRFLKQLDEAKPKVWKRFSQDTKKSVKFWG